MTNDLLDLDALMSADIRLAERSVEIITRADLEAEIDRLDAELDALTDGQGRPLVTERAMGDRTPAQVAAELRAVQRRMEESKVNVRLRQLNSLAWDEFHQKHRALFDHQQPVPADVQDELIAASIMTTAPATTEQIHQLRTRLGNAAMTVLVNVALDLNVGGTSGVKVPSSPLSDRFITAEMARHEVAGAPRPDPAGE